MAAIVYEGDIRIPEIRDLEEFRRWVRSDDFPEQGRFSFIAGDIWVALMGEQIFTHGQVVAEFLNVLFRFVKTNKLGYFFNDRTWLTNKEADLSTEPDGIFVSRECLQAGRVYYEGNEEGPLELVGSPDMVLEVVSKNSVRKDTKRLRDLYWEAEILEYWLVDARGQEPHFEIMKRGPKGYVPTRARDGWLASRVFGCAFRLVHGTDEFSHPEFTLEMRS